MQLAGTSAARRRISVTLVVAGVEIARVEVHTGTPFSDVWEIAAKMAGGCKRNPMVRAAPAKGPESMARATLFLMAQVTLESGRVPLSRARSQASRSLTEVLS